MATYKVQPNQNIFDISLQLYGTIEGIFDLLITNTWLDMDMDLEAGQEIEYHEDFVLNKSIVTQLSEDGIVPSNGERHVYYKRPTEELFAVCDIDASLEVVSFVAGGEGVLIVDWGDNADLEYFQLSHTNATITHYFNSDVEKRRVKLYGDIKLTYLNTTNLSGSMIITRPIVVDEYVCYSNGCDLTGLLLFKDTYSVDLKKSTVSDLQPIGDMYLQELNLTQVLFTDSDVVSKYLNYVIQHYGTRRGCTVHLDSVSDAELEAIYKIVGEEEWNTHTAWRFLINGEDVITYEKDSDVT